MVLTLLGLLRLLYDAWGDVVNPITTDFVKHYGVGKEENQVFSGRRFDEVSCGDLWELDPIRFPAVPYGLGGNFTFGVELMCHTKLFMSGQVGNHRRLYNVLGFLSSDAPRTINAYGLSESQHLATYWFVRIVDENGLFLHEDQDRLKRAIRAWRRGISMGQMEAARDSAPSLSHLIWNLHVAWGHVQPPTGTGTFRTQLGDSFSHMANKFVARRFDEMDCSLFADGQFETIRDTLSRSTLNYLLGAEVMCHVKGLAARNQLANSQSPHSVRLLSNLDEQQMAELNLTFDQKQAVLLFLKYLDNEEYLSAEERGLITSSDDLVQVLR